MNGCMIVQEYADGGGDPDGVTGSATIYLAPAPILAEMALTLVTTDADNTTSQCGFLSYTSVQSDGSGVLVNAGWGNYIWNTTMSSFTFGVAAASSYLRLRIVMQVW